MCRDETLRVTDDDVTLTQNIKLGIVDKLSNYYNRDAAQKLLHKCTMLDPCYKDLFADGAVLEEAKADLHAEMVALARRETTTSESRPVEAERSAAPPPPKKKSHWPV